jgi:exosortase A
MKVTDLRFVCLLCLLICAWVLVFFDALLAMQAIWSRSDTFAHGYFILPISVWLVWRQRESLFAEPVNATWLALPLLIVFLLIAVLANAADINVLGQVAAIFSLICIVWLMVGHKIAWRYKFPLAYLFFAVPMGENLIPWLQEVTAYITVFLLKIQGVAVFKDGLYFQIPSGLFEVAVACSGIRYLIASAAVGTLYAHISYAGWVKKCIFILFSLTMPILANGIRAYLIVLIAHYSEMKYATGADHLVYGWLFFGLVILLMFYIGGKFADSDTDSNTDSNTDNAKSIATAQHAQSQTRAETGSSLQPTVIRAGTAMLVLLTSFTLLHSVTLFNVDSDPNLLTLVNPETLGQEQSHQEPSQPLSALVGDNEIQGSSWGITFFDSQQRSHLITDKSIEIFRAVYRQQQNLGELVSWQNTLYAPKRWTVIVDKSGKVNGHSAQFLTLRSHSGEQRSVIYWYQIGGYITASKSLVKLLQALIFFIAPDVAAEIIAVSKQGSDEQKNFTLLTEFIPDVSKLKRP